MENKIFLSALVVLLFMVCFCARTEGPNHQKLRGLEDSQGGVAEDKVHVQISIESLCIDSKIYMLKQVLPVFLDSPLSTLMDLEIVVFGNAQLHTAAQTVTCQHGVAECDANIYEQCAIDNYIYPSRYLPFLGCLFETLPMGHADVAYDASYFAQCARVAALDFSTLATCHAKDAWAMQVQSSVKTPPHDHVPWIVVDGVHVSDENDTASLADIVCQALKKKGGHVSYCDN